MSELFHRLLHDEEYQAAVAKSRTDQGLPPTIEDREQLATAILIMRRAVYDRAPGEPIERFVARRIAAAAELYEEERSR